MLTDIANMTSIIERTAREVERRGVTVPPEVWQDLEAVKAVDWRADAESALTKKIAKIFSDYAGRAVSMIAAGGVPELGEMYDKLRATMISDLAGAVLQAAEDEAAIVGVMFDPAQVNQVAVEWARSYTFDWVKGIEKTTADVLRDAFTEFQTTPAMTRGQLEALIAPTFGEWRASLIAVTETTRAASRGMSIYKELLSEGGVEMEEIWHTLNDSVTCIICRPLNGKTEAEWGADYPLGPPAHPGCRCGKTLRYKGKEK